MLWSLCSKVEMFGLVPDTCPASFCHVYLHGFRKWNFMFPMSSDVVLLSSCVCTSLGLTQDWVHISPHNYHHCHYMNTCPEGRPGISYVSPLFGISGLSVLSHFSISLLLFFCLVLSFFLSFPFLFLARSRDLFFPKPPFSVRQVELMSQWAQNAQDGRNILIRPSTICFFICQI